jgi:hypothetical protein
MHSALVFNTVSNPEQHETSSFVFSLPSLRKGTQSKILRPNIKSEQSEAGEIEGTDKSFSDFVTKNNACTMQVKIIILFIFDC